MKPLTLEQWVGTVRPKTCLMYRQYKALLAIVEAAREHRNSLGAATLDYTIDEYDRAIKEQG